jgi:pre-mRNA-processing factor 6
VEKVKKWLENACTVNKDNGDAWAHRLRYEVEFGNSNSQQEVIDEFLAAEPRHGLAWSREAKRVENWRRDKVEIIKKVAREIKMYDE